MPQNEDGTVHFAYFRKDTQTSYVWDGLGDSIEVCWGGYAEPATDSIEAPAGSNASVPQVMEEFKRLCDADSDSLLGVKPGVREFVPGVDYDYRVH